MYDWLRQRYENQLLIELRDKIVYENMDESEADTIFNQKMEEWETEYGDYMYDARGDR